MNLNKFAIDITKKEGLKKSISIAQVKEVIKLVLVALAKLTPHQVEVLCRTALVLFEISPSSEEIPDQESEE